MSPPRIPARPTLGDGSRVRGPDVEIGDLTAASLLHRPVPDDPVREEELRDREAGCDAEARVLCTLSDAVAASNRSAAYAGDVWFPQPAPGDHPWRTMPHHGMTPHTSGTSLPSQARNAAGTREILEAWFAGTPIRPEYLIVDGGAYAGTGAHSYAKQ